MVEPLEVEPQHPARPVNLERVLILAPDAEAGRLERSGAPVLEHHERHHRVVHRASGASVRALATVSVIGPFRYSAVSSECVNRSSPTPDPASADPSSSVAGARRVGAPLLLVGGVVMEDRAEAAFVDQLARIRDGGHAPVVEPHQRRHAAGRLAPSRALRRATARAAFRRGRSCRLPPPQSRPGRADGSAARYRPRRCPCGRSRGASRSTSLPTPSAAAIAASDAASRPQSSVRRMRYGRS